VVNGATSGVTQVSIINRGGLGAQTIEGIKIVDVTGASNGTFVLNGNYVFRGAPAVIAGAYAYRLYQGGISTPADGDWYLRSFLNDPGPPNGSGAPDALTAPNAPGEPNTASSPPATPLYQPGVPVYEVYGSNLQSLNTLPTLQQRIGNRIWTSGANGDGNGVWGRTEGTHERFSSAAMSTTGLKQTIDTRAHGPAAAAVSMESPMSAMNGLMVGALWSQEHPLSMRMNGCGVNSAWVRV